MFGVQLVHGDPAGVTSNYTDSLFTLRWDAVPGAANYVLHVFQPQSDARAPDVLASAIPGPLTIGKTRDQFLVLLPGTVTQYRLGDPGGIVLARGKTFMGQAYLARMSALDAQGRVIGIGVPRTSFAGEAVYGLLDFTQSEVKDRLPPEVASRIVEEAFAVAPDAVVTFDLLALSVQTQAKLPDLETYVRVFRPPYDPGVWNPAGPAAQVLVAPGRP
jgi:hypothetical protein